MDSVVGKRFKTRVLSNSRFKAKKGIVTEMINREMSDLKIGIQECDTCDENGDVDDENGDTDEPYKRGMCKICNEERDLMKAEVDNCFDGTYYNGWFDNYQLCDSCIDDYFACCCKFCRNVRCDMNAFSQWQNVYKYVCSVFGH